MTLLLDPPARDGGALIWAPSDLDPAVLQKRGWTVYSFRDIRERFIAPARARDTARTTLENPAKPLLDVFAQRRPIAVIGVSLRTPADLLDLYGFVVEPAFRRGTPLLIGSDLGLEELDPDTFVDAIGYPWTLERLRYVADRFRLGSATDGLPPFTPIEQRLFDAMRARGLTPIPQYGVGPYRLDFAFTDARVAVECDGRPWHDPDRDRRRDAGLQKVGWEPIHFTGSEIHQDAAACAVRVERRVSERRRLIETEQPEILIPTRSSPWARLLAWFRSLTRRAARPISSTIDETTEAAATTASAWTADLDLDQQAAVRSHDGVVQVIAPAGSGKTTVLVSRVRELLARGVAPNRILCCTFNRDAATELQERLDQAGAEGVEATTFHAIGRKVLKKADLLRADVGTTPYGSWRRLAKQAMNATEDGPWIDAPEAQELISDLKLGRMLTVEEFDKVASGPFERTLAALYGAYQAELETQDRNDFDDFIIESVRLLRGDADARRHWQGRYSAVLVDEYQDIEPAQELLIEMLAAPEDLLFCVGDEDQCLYAWRRASVERVIELDQQYPGLERHALSRNYRSPSLIVDASRALIGHNRRRFPKLIEAARSEPGTITLVAASDLEAQAAHAARLVADLEQGQAVILGRTSRVLSDIGLGLAQAGIRFFGPERIKRRSGEPAILLSYVRLLGQPSTAREEDVKNVFRVPNRYLPDDAELNVASALRQGRSFAEAIGRLAIREEWRRKPLHDAAQLLDRLSTIQDAAELIHALRTEGDLDRHYASAERMSPTDQSAVDTLTRAEETAGGMSAREYADALDYQANIIEQHFDPKGIELATIHGAKGRQWPLVIVAAAEQGELPHTRSLMNAEDPAGELEGERRLAYVAFTRASESLVVMHRAEAPSQFIAEAAPVAERIIESPRSPRGDPRPSTATASSRSSATPMPVTRARAISRPASTVVFEDGSIPCSLPGCPGIVTASFVIEMKDGPLGLCPKVEQHQRIVASSPSLSNLFDRLTELNDASKREWRARNPPSSTKELVSGAMRCSVPGCGGIVKPDFVFSDGERLAGLCGQGGNHERLAVGDVEVARELGRLQGLESGARRRSRPGLTDYLASVLTAGGIPCSVPGCDGVVGPSYVIEDDGRQLGICGLAANHSRLVQANPVARLEFQRLQILERDRRQRWEAQGTGAADVDIDVNELPF